MGPLEVDAEAAAKRRLSSPRPGHADLAGGLKYGRRDLRDVLERASARESAARVAAGALCRQFLAAFGVRVRSGVLSLGPVSVPAGPRGLCDLERVDEASPFRAVDRDLEAAMTAAVDAAAKAGDTLGGTILVGARGVPAGLGSHVSWDDKLDGRIARALMSIPSVKGVSLGEAVANAGRPGSEAHDAILFERGTRLLPRHEPRRRPRGRDHERRGRPRDALPEADRDAARGPAVDRHRHEAAAPRAVRTLGRHGRARLRRHRRSDAGVRPRGRAARKDGRGLDGRVQEKLRRFHPGTEEILSGRREKKREDFLRR